MIKSIPAGGGDGVEFHGMLWVHHHHHHHHQHHQHHHHHHHHHLGCCGFIIIIILAQGWHKLFAPFFVGCVGVSPAFAGRHAVVEGADGLVEGWKYTNPIRQGQSQKSWFESVGQV